MADRKCPKCSKDFNYPHELKKHFKNSYHCLKTEDEITQFFIDNMKPRIQDMSNIECEYCHKFLSTKSALTRHLKTCKAKAINTSSNFDKILGEKVIDFKK